MKSREHLQFAWISTNFSKGANKVNGIGTYVCLHKAVVYNLGCQDLQKLKEM